MTAAPFHLAGQRLMLDPGGCLNWPAQRMLVVADLQIGKLRAPPQPGNQPPAFDTRDTLVQLAAHIRTYAPRVVLCLGHPYSDAKAALRIPQAEHARLAALAKATPFIWVFGQQACPTPSDLPGETTDEHRVGPLVFRHQAASGRVAGEISGYFQPKATLPLHGLIATRPCFIADGYRVMLPALGAPPDGRDVGGRDVGDSAISALFPRGGRVFLLGRERLSSAPIAPSRPGFDKRMPPPEPLLTRG